jgi:hypothetical protein
MVTKVIKYIVLEIVHSFQNQYPHNIDYDSSTHSCQVYLPSRKLRGQNFSQVANCKVQTKSTSNLNSISSLNVGFTMVLIMVADGAYEQY